MIVNPINVSDLVISTVYTNLKMSILQRGVLPSFVVNSVNSDGTFDVTLTYNDSFVSEITMDSDAVVFEVDDELLTIVPTD